MGEKLQAVVALQPSVDKAILYMKDHLYDNPNDQLATVDAFIVALCNLAGEIGAEVPPEPATGVITDNVSGLDTMKTEIESRLISESSLAEQPANPWFTEYAKAQDKIQLMLDVGIFWDAYKRVKAWFAMSIGERMIWKKIP